MAKLIKCKACGAEIAKSAKTCPHCGAKNKRKGPWGTIITVLVILALVGSCSSDDVEEAAPTGTIEHSASVFAPAETTQVPTEDSVPYEYRAALAKAETYAEMMHMSKSAIYNQLVSEYGEKFSPEAAQYAVDNVEADWNANALAKAKSYQEMNMSPAAIRDQLVSEYGEGFTEEQVDYAIENLEK